MNIFAITPGHFTEKDVIKHLPRLKDQGVSFLYLRSPFLFDAFATLIPAVHQSGIKPIAPFQVYNRCKDIPFGIGVHFKSDETDFLLEYKQLPSDVSTVACHDVPTAAKLLEQSVDYAFISPVFKPLSKPGDSRELLDRTRLKELITRFGQQVVLLGGLTRERVEILQEEMEADFSIAGITMFFRNNL
jgi:hypothetical protein